VWQGRYGVTLTSHCFGRDKRINDSLFRGLHGCEKNWIDLVVGHYRDLLETLRRTSSRIRGREGNENVS
jgi:hypothetical protein